MLDITTYRILSQPISREFPDKAHMLLRLITSKLEMSYLHFGFDMSINATAKVELLNFDMWINTVNLTSLILA